MFDRFIGVDYSRAGDPRRPNKGLAVAVAEPLEGDGQVEIVRQSWTREAVYRFMLDELRTSNRRVIIGLDHGLSYPAARLEELGLDSWDAFLVWFRRRWRTSRLSVEQAKTLGPYASSTFKRLAEREFTPGAKSVLDLDRRESLQGTVSYSTHAGLAWIARLRRLQRLGLLRVHFWPFDGFSVPDGCHVVAEAYPSLYRKRLALDAGLSEHERDAAAIAAWLRDRDRGGTLGPYLALTTLTREEQAVSRLEGWILGCL